ncbi:Armadillo/beta-catenin repeat family protein / kinesin motor family protein [Prunus dulcis]|uniref:Armadillo/beta-catenin repeat family protein / kinesin motor family protein n=1 Tax=Prunus dulcis TaxID=3755 RepID=A0A4Y1RG24_PRUDU|nr:Armadillo/beta-catenin repeat family protein / kinesin motor family protein [Prunus dulcis]
MGKISTGQCVIGALVPWIKFSQPTSHRVYGLKRHLLFQERSGSLCRKALNNGHLNYLNGHGRATLIKASKEGPILCSIKMRGQYSNDRHLGLSGFFFEFQRYLLLYVFASGEVEDPFLKFHFSLLIAMAASGGYNYRDGTQRSSHKVDRPLSLNSNPKSSVKSKALPASGPAGTALALSAVVVLDLLLLKMIQEAFLANMALMWFAFGSKTRVSIAIVRVAVRLRPRNAEEMVADADFADCVELQPELKRLKLRKNNWDTDTYEFDEVLTEFASQKRVYEVVAKPVVESPSIEGSLK